METDEDLRRALQGQGMTLEEFTRQMQDQILKSAIIYSEVDSKIVIDDAEVAQYYRLHPDEFHRAEEYTARSRLPFVRRPERGRVRARRKEASGEAAGCGFCALASRILRQPR